VNDKTRKTAFIENKVWILAFALIFFASEVYAQPKGDSLVVIVSPQSAVQALTLIELRRIFLAEVTYAAGEPVLPLNLASGSPERLAFDQLVLDMSQAQVDRYWINRKVRGQGMPPKSLPAVSLIQRLTSKHPTVIAYCFAHDLTPEVRPVMIDGKTFNAPNYPLKIASSEKTTILESPLSTQAVAYR
jgi:hypothetical protein